MHSELDKYVTAQNYSYKNALEEIKNGEKTSHWMWYIFPQLQGLGESDTAIYYGINSLKEAEDFLNHEILGPRLKEITSELLKLDTNDPVKVFGDIDAMKLKSSMTLFDLVEENSIFNSVLEKYYQGQRDELTIQKLESRKM